jgi:NAD(P)H-flavin reductase
MSQRSAMPSNVMVPKLYRVQRVRHEIPGTFTMEMEPQDGSTIPPFATGQFNMLYVFGVGEIPISISGDPGRPTPLVHTTRAVGTVSRALQNLKEGDTLGVRGPFGSHWPIEQATGKDVVIVAGGIGLAPLRSTMYYLIERRAQYDKVSLLYGARTPSEILYRHELERWKARLDLDVYITVDRADSSWRGSVGVVPQLIRRAAFDPYNALALVCGPEIMMRFTAAELEKQGMAADHVYVSMERNMQCAVGLCGHCQYGPHFVCRDGPVFCYSHVQHLLVKAEI